MNNTEKENCSFVSFVVKLLILCTVTGVKSEIFTAVADLEEVLQTESHLINTLEDYIRAEEERLNRLKRYAAHYKSHHDKAFENVQSYVENPINAYTLVKRLTTDWREVENLISLILNPDYVAQIANIKETMKFPADEDLEGAAVALIRLQDTYHLDTSSLARGELNGKKYSLELSADDCLELGRQSFHNEDYYYAQLWLKEAESRLKGKMDETVERQHILGYLAVSSYNQGDTSLALELTNKFLEIWPNHPTALSNKLLYEDELEKSILAKNEEDVGSYSVEKDENTSTIGPLGEKFYKPLCRGEISLPMEKASKLKCRYLTRNNPFLLISPFKVEEAHHEPDIFIFHDVLSDSEIATIKRLSQSRYERSGVVASNATSITTKIASYRVSKSAWLDDEEHKHIADVSQRISDMTGLTMESAESLQVANYGIGGHYEPHFDFVEGDNVFDHVESPGNRIATVLIYMSDVEQGGATVFSLIRVALWPEKGAAAFWHNLDPSGTKDRLTKHAACPVLIGSKWVANKWIHERGQEFLRPCPLETPSVA